MATGPLLEVARVLRPHGLRGEVVLEVMTNRSERLAPGASLQVGGDGRTLTVVAARPLPTPRHAHHERWLARFESVETREASEALRAVVLMATPLDEPGTLWVHELIGAMVETGDGQQLGRVVAVEANPASDLLVLEDGTLIPLRFVVEAGGGRVVAEIPDGLLDD